MDDEWTRLRAAWQATAPSPGELEASVRAASRRMRVGIAVEWVAGALVVGFWLRQAVVMPHPIVFVLGGGSVVFVAVWLTMLHRTLGRAPAPTGSVRAHLHTTAELARRQERWYVFARRSLLAFCGFATLVMPWKAWVDWEMYRAEPWRAVVGFGGFFALSAALFAVIGFMQRRAAESAARLEAAAAAYEEG